MANYQKLIAWQKSRVLVREIYRCTRGFPKEELFCLVAQMRRAALSVICNVAESQSRGSNADCAHFLAIALGSVLEVETQVIVAQDLDYLQNEDAAPLTAQTAEIGRILNTMIRTLTR